ncbi:hypothetical protein D6825_01950, partial [Candidatus Woesearchaeota archaeon]
MLPELISDVKAADCCLVLETTNTVTSPAYKTEQARRARTYLQRRTERDIYSGLVYNRMRNHFQDPHGLDIILHVEHFDEHLAQEALEKVIRATKKREKEIAGSLLSALKRGATLESLIAPKPSDWKKIRDEYDIASKSTSYSNYIRTLGQTKGSI